jgi:hypothetical protein
MFHVDLLTPYHETEFHERNYERPPPDLINGEEEYEIERVVDSQRHGRGGKIQYLVKWKGYPDSENQWVSWDDVNTPELLAECRKRNPNALSCHVSSRTGHALQVFHTDYHWDHLRPYCHTSLTLAVSMWSCGVSCDV